MYRHSIKHNAMFKAENVKILFVFVLLFATETRQPSIGILNLEHILVWY